MIPLLLILLIAAVAFAAYQLSDAKRWRQTAAEARSDMDKQRLELDEARRIGREKEGESVKTREIAELQVRLLTQTQQQLEEKFRTLAAEALQNNSQLLLDRSREQIQQIRLRKLRLRGLPRAGEQFILAATVQNIKRLVRFVNQGKEPEPAMA